MPLEMSVFWLQNYFHMNIYWHPWFSAIITTFGYMEVSFAQIVLWMSWKEPAPLESSHVSFGPKVLYVCATFYECELCVRQG